MDPTITHLEQQLRKTIEHLKSEYAKLQTGRASAVVIEHVLVDAYGQHQPLKAVAGISIQDARTIVVQPWDRGIIGNVEKALQQANLGTNPVNDGTVLRIVLPPMTEERRRSLSKTVHTLAEEARISVRKQRQEVHAAVKKDKKRAEDERYTIDTILQDAVNKANAEIEQLAKRKEQEIMTI